MQKITKISIILLLFVFTISCIITPEIKGQTDNKVKNKKLPKSTILGKWEFVSVDGSSDLLKGYKGGTLEFKKDETVNMVDGKKKQTAKFQFDKDEKTLRIKLDDNQMVFSDFQFKTKNKIQFTLNKKVMIMEREENTKNDADDTDDDDDNKSSNKKLSKSAILGKWEFVSVGDKTDLPKDFKESSLEFKKNGEVDMFDSKKTKTASYEFSKDEKKLTIKFDNREMIFSDFRFKNKNTIQFIWNTKATVMEKQ